jgi:chemotaxis signal transduction protein
MTAKVALLLFAGRNFSLPVDRIRHILQEPELFRLPALCNGLAGAFMFAEELIPMVSADILSDLGPYRPGKGNYTIVYQSDYGVVGLPVETSVKIVDESDGSYRHAPLEEESAVVSQFFNYQDFDYPVLDVDKMLTLLSI